MNIQSIFQNLLSHVPADLKSEKRKTEMLLSMVLRGIILGNLSDIEKLLVSENLPKLEETISQIQEGRQQIAIEFYSESIDGGRRIVWKSPYRQETDLVVTLPREADRDIGLVDSFKDESERVSAEENRLEKIKLLASKLVEKNCDCSGDDNIYGRYLYQLSKDFLIPEKEIINIILHVFENLDTCHEQYTDYHRSIGSTSPDIRSGFHTWVSDLRHVLNVQGALTLEQQAKADLIPRDPLKNMKHKEKNREANAGNVQPGDESGNSEDEIESGFGDFFSSEVLKV